MVIKPAPIITIPNWPEVAVVVRTDSVTLNSWVEWWHGKRWVGFCPEGSWT